jgi:hypothetical protein
MSLPFKLGSAACAGAPETEEINANAIIRIAMAPSFPHSRTAP